jgi:hypothetical protein
MASKAEEISDISRKLSVIKKRIEYLRAHPQEITLGQSWDGKPYAECTNLMLLEAEQMMMTRCGDVIMRRA